MKDEIERNTPLTQIRYLHISSPSLLPHSPRYHLNRSLPAPQIQPLDSFPRCSFTFTHRQSSNFPPPPSPPRRSTFFSKRHRNYASPSSLSFLLSFLLPPLDRLNFNHVARGEINSRRELEPPRFLNLVEKCSRVCLSTFERR